MTGSRTAGIAVAYELIGAAQSRRRAINAPHLVTVVRDGARFESGKLVERRDDTAEEAASQKILITGIGSALPNSTVPMGCLHDAS